MPELSQSQERAFERSSTPAAHTVTSADKPSAQKRRQPLQTNNTLQQQTAPSTNRGLFGLAQRGNVPEISEDDLPQAPARKERQSVNHQPEPKRAKIQHKPSGKKSSTCVVQMCNTLSTIAVKCDVHLNK